MSIKKNHILLLLIIALAIFLRVWNINEAPPGVYPDEAVNGIDALSAIESGNYEWFYPANNGREGLFMNIIAVFFQLFGISVFTLKLPAIICGTLTVWGTYLLGKELFSSARIGLIAAFLTSVSFWAINFSRISFRANMLPAILAFSFYFLFKGLRTKKWYDFAFGGLIFGLGMHSYIAFRIAPVVLVVMLFVFILNRNHFLKNFWKQILVFVLFTTITAFPMIYTLYIAHPEYAQSRSASISIMDPEVNQGNLAKTFFRSLSLSVLKYNFWGDQNWRHNFPPYPLLDPITGAAFMFGLAYAMIKFFHLLLLRFRKKVSDEKTEVFAFLLSFFFLLLAPEFMTAEGNPHALRAIGTIPVVFIFSALTFNFFLGKVESKNYFHKKIIFALIFVMLLSVGIFNSVKYHLVWAKKPQTANSFEKNLMDISSFAKTLPVSQEKIVFAENMQRVTIKLFTNDLENIRFAYFGEAGETNPESSDFIIIMTHHDHGALEKLQKKFPSLKLEEKNDGNGTKFYVLN
jgi:4-amino-4-deoxy-L-arabinose transferase-like glycosyltransferase